MKNGEGRSKESKSRSLKISLYIYFSPLPLWLPKNWDMNATEASLENIKVRIYTAFRPASPATHELLHWALDLPCGVLPSCGMLVRIDGSGGWLEDPWWRELTSWEHPAAPQCPRWLDMKMPTVFIILSFLPGSHFLAVERITQLVSQSQLKLRTPLKLTWR
jgi:hypothetical protein